MRNLNTKPDYDKLNELYHKALNDNRLMKAKHKKIEAGLRGENTKITNNIEILKSHMRALIKENEFQKKDIEQLRKEIPCQFENEKYRIMAENNNKLREENKTLKFIKKQAEFIMSKIS